MASQYVVAEPTVNKNEFYLGLPDTRGGYQQVQLSREDAETLVERLNTSLARAK